MPPWLIVTSGWPGGLAAATGAVAWAGAHHLVPVAVTAAAALTFGCGSLLRRRLDRKARRAAIR